MWNDRHPKRPLVTMGNIEEMDVCLSLREYREFVEAFSGAERAAQLLSGSYVLEP